MTYKDGKKKVGTMILGPLSTLEKIEDKRSGVFPLVYERVGTVSSTRTVLRSTILSTTKKDDCRKNLFSYVFGSTTVLGVGGVERHF